MSLDVKRIAMELIGHLNRNAEINRHRAEGVALLFDKLVEEADAQNKQPVLTEEQE